VEKTKEAPRTFYEADTTITSGVDELLPSQKLVQMQGYGISFREVTEWNLDRVINILSDVSTTLCQVFKGE
jgi:hypothetical protein